MAIMIWHAKAQELKTEKDVFERQLVMRNPGFRRIVFALAVGLSVVLWLGCATNKAPQTAAASKDGFQVLYPHETYSTLDPLQRSQMDRAMRMEGWCREK